MTETESTTGQVFVPSHPLEPGDRYGVLSGFDPGTRVLPAGFRLTPAFMALPVDIVLDKDVAVTLRDGVTIYVDVLRPVGAEKVPVIVAWSPYGKGQGSSPSAMGVFGLVGLDNAIVSGLNKFEGPDPAYWCAHGYAVCNPDARGTVHSEGDSVLWDRQEGRDCHDLIEWLAAQNWCTGKVAMSGTSYLAAAQWFTAAEQPPHLAAINPTEGISDTYRDLAMRGGMPDTGFARLMQDNSFRGNGRKEDILAETERNPLVDDLWENKIPRYDQITVPAYVVASYSNTLHTLGTFRAWRRMRSPDKWLRIHNSQEWPDYYDQANQEDLRRFLDHFLKDADNGWEQTPRVRYALLDLQGGDRTDQPADRFPPADVSSTRYYLDGRARTLCTDPPADGATASYDTQTNPRMVSFTTRFDHETVLVGYPKAYLWIEADGADDMDLFVLVQKLDAHGTPLREFTVPNRTAILHDLTEHGGSILRYQGSDGRLRVSMRHLDADLSTDEVPAHTFDRVEKLQPGEVVEIEVELAPIGLVFHPGQQLRLIISAWNTTGTWMPGLREYVPQNSGRHIVHTGGSHASWLQLPVQDRRRPATTVTLASGLPTDSIDEFELFSARRALALLKSRLGHQGLLELLADDIAEGNTILRERARESGQEFVGGTVVLSAVGLRAADFESWLGRAFADESVLLAAHPEHWGFAAALDGRVNVVETFGSHPSSFFMAGWGAERPAWVAGSGALLPESEFPITTAADLVLADGTVIGRVLCQFGDTTTGFSCALSVFVPDSCEQTIDQHLRHFAVEFRNWIVAAVDDDQRVGLT